MVSLHEGGDDEEEEPGCYVDILAWHIHRQRLRVETQLEKPAVIRGDRRLRTIGLLQERNRANGLWYGGMVVIAA